MTDNDQRQVASSSDVNNNELTHSSKRKNSYNRPYATGQIKELHLQNFMCYQNFSMQFYSTHLQIVMGANGSGKSSIANAICLCLGAQARATGRTSNAQSFIRKDTTFAELTIVLANEGPEAYKPDVYGKEIRIVRKIGSRQSSYKIIGANRKVISTHKETVDEITQALSISPENPLCVLHQDIAKTFLINSDPGKKYQFYMKVSQLDQMKQAYEQGVLTAQLLTRRVNAMKEKHLEMLRELEPLAQEIRKIKIRRDYEERKHGLEDELIAARADKVRQELHEIQDELNELRRTKHDTDTKIAQENDRVASIDRRLDQCFIEKNDLEQDTNGLRQLRVHFAKQKHSLQLCISSLTRDCEDHRRVLTEVELKQIYLQKQMDEYESLHNNGTDIGEERLRLDQELFCEQEKQIEWDRIRLSLSNDLCVSETTLSDKQSSIAILEQQFKEKQHDLDQLTQKHQDRIHVYGPWMMECLKSIQNDPRFHTKPIGPIGLHIQCTNPHWSYAVEKHLAPIMSSFICTDNADERILLDILASYSADHRPPVYVRSYSNKAHDISGTLKHTQQANLLTIYDVLKIDNITVECVLIDVKQIEATILLETLAQAKHLQQSGVLSWKKIDRKVKQVTEVWTSDGSNVKLDKTFRIYTNEKQTIKYFLSNHFQSLSTEELKADVRQFSKQLQQMRESLEQFRTIHQTIVDRVDQAEKEADSNKKKVNELMKELNRLNSLELVPLNSSLDQLREKATEYLLTYEETVRKYDVVKDTKDGNVRQLTEITENYENMSKTLDTKTYQYDLLIEEIRNEQSQRFAIMEEIKKLTKRSSQFNGEIGNYQIKVTQLKKKQSKRMKSVTTTIRSVRSIEQELYAIDNYLKANEDTNEIRREIIQQYRNKRDIAKEYKQNYERCHQQIEHFHRFIQRRQEGFLTIADQHQYCLRVHFQNLMKNYHFHESTIRIDDKKEELEIVVKKHQTNLASLSSGERSIATFCFLLALWESIYQPFRLLDEIDIYMDNEKRQSSLDILYQNTKLHSSSQHIILTPQTIDVRLWDDFDVPVYSMPTPKRSL